MLSKLEYHERQVTATGSLAGGVLGEEGVLREKAFERVRAATCAGGVLLAPTLAGCGSSGAKVGDCTDAHKHVVACTSSNATLKLVAKQTGSTAIACVAIGNQPQVQVKVDGTSFCAVRH